MSLAIQLGWKRVPRKVKKRVGKVLRSWENCYMHNGSKTVKITRC